MFRQRSCFNPWFGIRGTTFEIDPAGLAGFTRYSFIVHEFRQNITDTNNIQYISGLKGIFEGLHKGTNYNNSNALSLLFSGSLFDLLRNTKTDNFRYVKDWYCGWVVAENYTVIFHNQEQFVSASQTYRWVVYKHKFTGDGSLGFNQSFPITIGGVPLKVRLKMDVTLSGVSITAYTWGGNLMNLVAQGGGTIQAEARIRKIMQVDKIQFGAQASSTYSANYAIQNVPVGPANLTGEYVRLTITGALKEYGVELALGTTTGWGLNYLHKFVEPGQDTTFKLPLPW